MDTEGIRLFVMATKLLNISAAGRQLGLAPAVASARLSKLENEIGADLLHRSTRKVSLSLEGQEFLPFAEEILAQEDAARAALGRDSAEITGTLRFAASSTFAQHYIAPILPELLQRHPGLNLQLKLSDLQLDLIEGGFDLALRNSELADSSLRARKLANDKRILCASPEYLKTHGTPVTPEDLANHQIMAFQGMPTLKLLNQDQQNSGTFPPQAHHSRVTCDDGASMRIMTTSGLGISMNSIWSVYPDLKTGKIVRVLPDYDINDNSAIWLVYPKSNVLTAKVRVFIDYLIEKIGTPPIWEK